MKKYLVLLLAACLILTVLTGSAAADSKPFVGFFFSDPVTTNFYGAMRDVDIYLWSMVGGAPVYLNPVTGEYDAGYIDQWEANEDYTVWTLHFSDNAFWSDGVPVTVDDFIFTQEYFTVERERLDEAIMWWNLGFDFEIEKIDDKTCKVHLPFAIADLMQYFAMPYLETMPKHIWENVEKEVFLTCDEGKTPIGCGPYVIVDYVPGQYYRFKANELYYNGAPEIKDVTMLIITEDSAMTMAMENGTLNYDADISPADYYRVSAMDGIEGFINKQFNHRAMGFNLDRVDINIRKAVNYLMDKDQWLETIYGNVGEILYGMFPRGVKYQTDEGLTYYEHNVEKAKELIEADGYTMGDDGYYQKDGKTLELEFLYNISSTNNALAMLLTDCCKEGGIKIVLNGQNGAQYGELRNQFAYDINPAGFALNSNPASYKTNYYKTLSSDPTRIMDKFDEAAAAVDEADQARIYHEIDKTVNEDVIWVFGIQQHFPVVYTSGLDISEALPSQSYNFVHWEKLRWAE